MVEAFIKHSVVMHSMANPIEVPPVFIDPAHVTNFTYALHDGYSNLNGFELEFAQALDKTQRVWFRNPSRGLFEIPLLTSGGSRHFNPDFIVWVDKTIVAIDPKADHLIMEDASRKLFFLDKIGSGPDITICLITRGEWSDNIEKLSGTGFTVWKLRNGKPHPLHVGNAADAVQICLR